MFVKQYVILTIYDLDKEINETKVRKGLVQSSNILVDKATDSLGITDFSNMSPAAFELMTYTGEQRGQCWWINCFNLVGTTLILLYLKTCKIQLCATELQIYSENHFSIISHIFFTQSIIKYFLPKNLKIIILIWRSFQMIGARRYVINVPSDLHDARWTFICKEV